MGETHSELAANDCFKGGWCQCCRLEWATPGVPRRTQEQDAQNGKYDLGWRPGGSRGLCNGWGRGASCCGNGGWYSTLSLLGILRQSRVVSVGNPSPSGVFWHTYCWHKEVRCICLSPLWPTAGACSALGTWASMASLPSHRPWRAVQVVQQWSFLVWFAFHCSSCLFFSLFKPTSFM